MSGKELMYLRGLTDDTVVTWKVLRGKFSSVDDIPLRLEILAMLKEVGEAERVLVDLSEVTRVSSGTISAFLFALKCLREKSKTLRLLNATNGVLEKLKMWGLETPFGCEADGNGTLADC